VEEGVAAGQPVIIGYDDRKTSLLRSWLSGPATVTFIADNSLYATPARAIASYWTMFERRPDPDRRGRAARGQRRPVRRMGPRRISGYHRLEPVSRLEPVPVRRHRQRDAE
jgi:hypothetical protein